MPQTLRAGPERPKRTRSRVALPLTNSVKEAVIATDLDGRVVFWNGVAERLYGWKWHEALGRQSIELTVPPSARVPASKIMDRLRKGKTWSGEFNVCHRDGSRFVADVTVKPMKDERGNLIGMIGISRSKDAEPHV